MIGVTITTSKRGYLWPTGHWKSLIDSLCRSGAKSDPRVRYPAFSHCLSPLVYETDGRFFPTSASQLATHDDAAVSFLRVTGGADSVALHSPEVPNTSGWLSFELPYFGTIGNSTYERQSKENRLALAACEELRREPTPARLWLHFQLSVTRRDRDLDNLADGLMPFFKQLVSASR